MRFQNGCRGGPAQVFTLGISQDGFLGCLSKAEPTSEQGGLLAGSWFTGTGLHIVISGQLQRAAALSTTRSRSDRTTCNG